MSGLVEQGQIAVAGEFAPGSTVFLVQHLGGAWLEHMRFGERVAEVTVPDEGDVVFEALPAGQRYWVIGDGYQGPKQLQMTAKAPQPLGPLAGLEAPRGTFPSVAQDVSSRPEEPSVGPRQQDVGGDVLQRSDTPVGAATVIPAGERSPKPSVEDAEGGVRASDTPAGELEAATERARQDDVPDDVLQRSSTPEGVATPIPAPAEPAVVGDDVHGGDLPELGDEVVLAGHPGEEAQEGVSVNDPLPVQDTSREGGSLIAASEEQREQANKDAGLAEGLATGATQPELAGAEEDLRDPEVEAIRGQAPAADLDLERFEGEAGPAAPEGAGGEAPPAKALEEPQDPRLDPATDAAAERTPREEVEGDAHEVVQVGAQDAVTSGEQPPAADAPSEPEGTVPGDNPPS